jgi:hypothetical protein
VNESIKEYLRRIGSKGGKAVAGTPQAKERAAKAAQARWAKLKQKRKKLWITSAISIQPTSTGTWRIGGISEKDNAHYPAQLQEIRSNK